MKKIIINSKKHGTKEVLIDEEDYKKISKYKWHVVNQSGLYVMAHYKINGKRITIKLHRIIMNTPSHQVVDHIDGNGLNNQKSNLRNCSNFQNAQNRISVGGISKYKGVCLTTNKFIDENGQAIFYHYWIARIVNNKKRIRIGNWPHTADGEILAAKAYDKSAKKYHGEFAKLNFPEDVL